MWRWTKRVSVAVVMITAVGAAVVVAQPGPGPAAQAALAGTDGMDGRKTVTLVTGDRVHVLDGVRPIVRVEPGQGRAGLAFYRQVKGGELSIVPADAAPLVTAGRLDAALFNVTRLIRDGYDDDARKDIPLIISGAPGRRAVAPAGVTVTRTLAVLNGAAVAGRKDRASSVWASLTQGHSTLRPEVGRVWLDAKVHATLDRSVPKIGAPGAWQAGYTGKGMTVGVLDTGIDAAHPDLTGAVVASKDFTGGNDVVDRNGHGTHVASTITGDGVADARYKGVAPDAKLVIGKVLDEYGSGEFSEVIAGMEWIATQRVQVVNMSLGAPIPSDGTDPMSAAINTLTARTGTLFVVAAGNDGAARTVLVPAVADAALTVGATDLDDALAEFSSRGPRMGDGAIKPDVTAPGVDIVAARAEGTEAGEPVGDRYTRLSGTSMAAPHVAGAAALLFQRHPGWTPAKVKSGLMNTARPNGTASVYDQGAGRIDVGRAVTQQVTTDLGSLSFDLRSATTTRQVTFRNDGGAPVRLALDLDVNGPDGHPAPDGMFTASSATLDVPAGGTATATVTAEPGQEPAGAYTGGLTARNGDTDVLRIPVGAVKEPPLHEIRLTGIDRNGRPAGSTIETVPWASITDLGTGEAIATYISGNGVAARVPDGRYAVNIVVPTGVADYALFSYPVVTVRGDLALTADARRARRVAFRFDSPSAVRSGWDDIGVVETIAGRQSAFGVAVVGAETSLSAMPTKAVTHHPYTFYNVVNKAEPDGPRAYHLQLLTKNHIPGGLNRRIPDSELAAVTSTYHADKPMVGRRTTIADVPGLLGGAGFGEYPVRLPGQRVELYNVSPALRWFRDLSAERDGQGFLAAPTASPPTVAGKAEHHWNIATPGAVVSTIRKARNRPMAFVVSPFASADARFQRSSPVTQQISVWRDGELLGSENSDQVWVTTPPGRARYTVRSTAERTASWTDLGTRSEAEWSFPYAPTLEAIEEAPLFSVRLQGPFDKRNQAPAGSRFVLTMGVTDSRVHKPGTPPRFGHATVETSFDDGTSWHPAKVTVTGENRWAVEVVDPPRPGGHVSVRVHLSDGAGTTLDQTVIRAYGLQ